MKNKITKREKNEVIKSTLIALGTLFMYFSLQETVLKLPFLIQIVIGGALVFIALKIF